MKKEKKNLMQKTNNWNLVLECIMPPEYWLLAREYPKVCVNLQTDVR